MFQKLKPVDDNPALKTGAASSDASPAHSFQTPTEINMSDTTNTTSSSSSTDVELDGLARRADQTPTTSYSPRPAAAPGAGFSSFPMARPGATTSSTTSSDGRKLVIGEGINISGEIEACPHLVVEGQVEATLKGANILEIAETGVFFGSVEINEATIAGRFEGDLKVDGRLTVRSTGVIIGSLSYRELAVEAGATIEGKITPLNGKSAARSNSTSKTSSQTTQSNTTQKRAAPFGSTDNELPFATKAAS